MCARAHVHLYPHKHRRSAAPARSTRSAWRRAQLSSQASKSASSSSRCAAHAATFFLLHAWGQWVIPYGCLLCFIFTWPPLSYLSRHICANALLQTGLSHMATPMLLAHCCFIHEPACAALSSCWHPSSQHCIATCHTHRHHHLLLHTYMHTGHAAAAAGRPRRAESAARTHRGGARRRAGGQRSPAGLQPRAEDSCGGAGASAGTGVWGSCLFLCFQCLMVVMWEGSNQELKTRVEGLEHQLAQVCGGGGSAVCCTLFQVYDGCDGGSQINVSCWRRKRFLRC